MNPQPASAAQARAERLLRQACASLRIFHAEPRRANVLRRLRLLDLEEPCNFNHIADPGPLRLGWGSYAVAMRAALHLWAQRPHDLTLADVLLRARNRYPESRLP